MKKYILVLIFSLVFLSACTQEIPIKEVITCTIDDDCIIVEGKECCGCPRAINKNYEEYWNSQSRETCLFRNCELCTTMDSLQPICERNFCTGIVKKISPPECQSDNDCITGGCSGTICQPKDAPPIFTTCEWKDEYACYKEVSCSCLNNNCKWDDQKKLDSCIQSYQ